MLAGMGRKDLSHAAGELVQPFITGRVIWQYQVKFKLCIPYNPELFPLNVLSTEILANGLQEVPFLRISIVVFLNIREKKIEKN